MPATRILATLGPQSWSEDGIRSLADAGARAFRLNFSHGKHEELVGVIERVRVIEAETQFPLSIVGDLSGPKMRTGPIEGAKDSTVLLKENQEVILSPDAKVTEDGVIAVGLPNFDTLVAPGQVIMLADGSMDLEVLSTSPGETRAVVRHGGELAGNQGINLPGQRVPIPALTDKDRDDLAFALKHGVDWLALSFVQEPRDVVTLKRLIALAGATTPVISKIEKPVALKNLSGILDVSDGIMVARGDLGVEVGIEKLPSVQKEIICAARRRNKLVITATQMLESMTSSPRPTRAETSDVANAMYDGTDVVMLSGETAVGDYPTETVEMMRDIAIHVESSELYRQTVSEFQRPEPDGIAQATARAACLLAEEVSAKALLAFSSSGRTAASLTGHRPTVPIFGMVHSLASLRRLALCWGITPILIASPNSLRGLHEAGIRAVVEKGRLQPGDKVVLVSGSVTGGAGANMIKVSKVPNR